MTMSGTKGRRLKVKVFSETSASNLETAVQSWLSGLGEATVVGDPLAYYDGANHVLIYHYTGA